MLIKDWVKNNKTVTAITVSLCLAATGINVFEHGKLSQKGRVSHDSTKSCATYIALKDLFGGDRLVDQDELSSASKNLNNIARIIGGPLYVIGSSRGTYDRALKICEKRQHL